MQFAMPPRKSSSQLPYARPSRTSPAARWRQLQLIASIGCVALVLTYVTMRLRGSSDYPNAVGIPLGTPEVVIVTVLEDGMQNEYVDMIKDNREIYAGLHGTLYILTGTCIVIMLTMGPT